MATTVLTDQQARLYAADCASRTLQRVGISDQRLLRAIETVRWYALGMATDTELERARNAGTSVGYYRGANNSALSVAIAAVTNAASANAMLAAEYAARNALIAAESDDDGDDERQWQREQIEYRKSQG